MHIDRRLALIGTAIGSIVLLAGCGAAATISAPAVAAPTLTPPPAVATAIPYPVTPDPTAVPTPVPTPTPVPPPTPVPETVGQANAVESAASYLSEGIGWSRNGLIGQLDSSAGEGFSKADATYGVDAQGADWNAQAVLSAQAYLSEGGWSRNGLIAQLDSSYGEGFTVAQATYGVTKAGL